MLWYNFPCPFNFNAFDLVNRMLAKHTFTCIVDHIKAFDYTVSVSINNWGIFKWVSQGFFVPKPQRINAFYVDEGNGLHGCY